MFLHTIDRMFTSVEKAALNSVKINSLIETGKALYNIDQRSSVS